MNAIPVSDIEFWLDQGFALPRLRKPAVFTHLFCKVAGLLPKLGKALVY